MKFLLEKYEAPEITVDVNQVLMEQYGIDGNLITGDAKVLVERFIQVGASEAFMSYLQEKQHDNTGEITPEG